MWFCLGNTGLLGILNCMGFPNIINIYYAIHIRLNILVAGVWRSVALAPTNYIIIRSIGFKGLGPGN